MHETTQKVPFASLRGRHAGAAALLVACGPSAHGLKPDLVPTNVVVLCVNDAERHFDRDHRCDIDYLLIHDKPKAFKQIRLDAISETAAEVFVCQSKPGHEGWDDWVPAGVAISRYQLAEEWSTERPAPTHLTWGKTSIPPALSLAEHLGIVEVGVLGVDLRGHFFERQSRRLSKRFSELAAAQADRGMRVVNLSPSSLITSWPHQDFDAWITAH